MRPERFRLLATSAVCCGLVSGLIAYAAADPSKAASDAPERARPRSHAPSNLDGLALVKRSRVEGDKVWSTLDDGQRVELTIDPKLQAHVSKVFARYAVPAAAFVAIEPATGKVLAYVSHKLVDVPGDMVVDHSPPAASVFKVITSAALLDAGVSPDTRMCYGGGLSSLKPVDLVDDPRRDRNCVSLAKALGASTNAVFAKLATRHLKRAELSKYAQAFGFGQRLPGELKGHAGPADIPEERLEFARTAAGFWHSYLSPLHGALIAATVANDGVMPNVRMVERVFAGDGRVLHARVLVPASSRRVLSAGTARELGEMMERTVREGTSRDAFHDKRGRPYLKGIDVAGKTGSLSGQNPYRAYSWWVGFAPADKPVVAMAALVVNSEKWRIKSSFVARDALEHWLLPKRSALLEELASERTATRSNAKNRRK